MIYQVTFVSFQGDNLILLPTPSRGTEKKSRAKKFLETDEFRFGHRQVKQ